MSENYDKIINVNIEDEMQRCYIDYAMSVIVSRALPDVRDGLKPVHRRILYAMSELNLDPTKSYRKSARIVGDTMGKYHPHGDSSIYQAMVRLAQDFSTRYMLVDGQGNFGSIDGDGAAAQRYTEAKLSKISMEMIADIDKNTVDFSPNFDGTLKEPVVLPSRIPNLLINGSSGIAVGMATNIPPHNLGEVIDGIVKIIDNYICENRQTDIEELIECIKGPDFPTGATVLGKSGIRSMYRTGRGKIIVRADAQIEPMDGTREQIVVNAIPYQVNKARLIEKIAELVKNKRIEGISDLRDESDINGMRIVIELKKDANAKVILNQLYKYTQLQESFGAIMLALVDGKPETLNLKQILELYLKHQEDVVTRRIKFDLNKAEKRAHILDGLKIALNNIDEVIKIIRESYDNAKDRLMKLFGLSDVQSQAILEMQLRRLQGLEKEKIENEYNDLITKIEYLKEILADESKLFEVIKEEILTIKSKYSDERRTKIVNNPGEIEVEDLIEEETSVITLTNLNYIKRMPIDTYRSQKRGGRGIIGMNTREEDFVKSLFVTSTHNNVLFFTNRGKVYKLKGYEIPEAGRTARGTAIINLLEMNSDETITAVIPIKEFNEKDNLVMITKQGIIKKTNIMSYCNIRKGGLLAINLKDNDQLVSVFMTNGNNDIFVATRNARGMKFNENDVRAIGRTGIGVRAISLSDDNYVVSADVVEEDTKVLTVTDEGYGKRTKANLYNLQSRGGKGIRIHEVTEKTGLLSGMITLSDKEEVMMMTSEGVIIRLKGDNISTFGRRSQGVRLINISEGTKVVGIAKISENDIEREDENRL